MLSWSLILGMVETLPHLSILPAGTAKGESGGSSSGLNSGTANALRAEGGLLRYSNTREDGQNGRRKRISRSRSKRDLTAKRRATL